MHWIICNLLIQACESAADTILPIHWLRILKDILSRIMSNTVKDAFKFVVFDITDVLRVSVYYIMLPKKTGCIQIYLFFLMFLCFCTYRLLLYTKHIFGSLEYFN